jgi:O-methyltransferase
VRAKYLSNRRLPGELAHRALAPRLQRLWEVLTLPSTVLYLLWSPLIDPAYGLSWPSKLRLGWRMLRTTQRVNTATSYKAHLAMAAKLLEIPHDVEGVVVECGCFLGGSTANLSLVCEIVGRKLIVYDSFEGLPAPREGDQYAREEQTGFLRADIETVRANVRRFGAIDRCTFRKGWFADTLPRHSEPVVLAFLDVDYQASLDDCVRNLWPHLTEKGYVFIDEYVLTDYCALFWSERYWRTHFDTTPPGLLGAGTGVGVGQYYLGPLSEWHAPQDPTSIAFTRKDLSGYWGYYPAAGESPDAGGG